MARTKNTDNTSTATFGFEAKLWLAADKPRLCDISIYGQESNANTRRLAVMNLPLRGIKADFGPEHADTFRRELHPDLRADTATRVSVKSKPRSHSAGLLRSERQLLANPPFNDSDWFRKDDDGRWQFGVPAQEQCRVCFSYAGRLEYSPINHGHLSTSFRHPFPQS